MTPNVRPYNRSHVLHPVDTHSKCYLQNSYFAEDIEAYSFFVGDDLYFVGGVLDVDGEIFVWTWFDRIIYDRPKSFLKLLKMAEDKFMEVHNRYSILVDIRDKRALMFAVRLGFINEGHYGDGYIRFTRTWQIH